MTAARNLTPATPPAGLAEPGGEGVHPLPSPSALRLFDGPRDEYEREKARLVALNLGALEYETAIAELAGRLGL